MQERGAEQKYITVKRAPSDEQLVAHYCGETTLAGFLVDQDGTAGAGLIELDVGGEEGARVALSALAAARIVAFAIVCPGAGDHNGSHVWALYQGRHDPAAIRAQLRAVALAAGLPDGEVYPSGKAIRLPFGLHTWTERRGVLLLQNGGCHDLDTAEGLAAGWEAVMGLPRNLPPPPAPVEQPTRPLAAVEPANEPTTGRVSAREVIARFKREHTAEQMLERAGATRTADGWACNCGIAHTHATQIYVTRHGLIGFYSARCRWAEGGQTDRNGNPYHNVWDFFAQVWHGGSTSDALKAYNPIRAQERDKDAERKRNARHAEAAAILQDVRNRAAQDEILARRPSEAAVLSALLEVAGDRHWCRPSKARLVEMTGWSLGAVKRALCELEARGYFISEGDGGGPEQTSLRTFLRGSPPSDDDGRSYVDQGDPRIKEERVSAPLLSPPPCASRSRRPSRSPSPAAARSTPRPRARWSRSPAPALLTSITRRCASCTPGWRSAK